MSEGLQGLFPFSHLEISVNNPVLVAVVDALQDLLDAVGGVGLGVELAGNDVLEQFTSRHPEKITNNCSL